jgi:hypothetical protein
MEYFKDADFKKGDIEDVVVSHIESPHSFYIQRVCTPSQVLETTLLPHFLQLLSLPVNFTIKAVMCSTRPFVSSDFLLPLHLVRLLGGSSVCKCRVWSLLCCNLVAEITCKVLLTCLYFVYCQAAQAVPDFLTQFVPENMYNSRATDLYVGTGVLFLLSERYVKSHGQQT